MRPRQTFVLISLAAAGLLAAGCETPSSVNTVQEAERTGVPRAIQDERLYTDYQFAQRLVVIGLADGQTPEGLRRVEAEVANLTAGTQRYKYRFTWYDRGGLVVDAPSGGWRDATVPGGGRERINTIAPGRSAVDFRLEMIGVG